MLNLNPEEMVIFSYPKEFHLSDLLILTFDPQEDPKHYESFCEILEDEYGEVLSEEFSFEQYHSLSASYFKPKFPIGFKIPKKPVEDLIKDQYKLIGTGIFIMLTEKYEPYLFIRDKFVEEGKSAPFQYLLAYRRLRLPLPLYLIPVLSSIDLSCLPQSEAQDLIDFLHTSDQNLKTYIEGLVNTEVHDKMIVLPNALTVH